MSLALLSPRSEGIGRAGVEIGDIRGAGWTARGVSLELLLKSDTGPAAHLRAESFEIAGAPGPLRNVTIACSNPQLAGPQWRCANARVRGTFGPIGRQDFRADITYGPATKALGLRLRGLKVARGALAVDGRWRAAGWEVALDARTVALEELRKLAAPWFAIPGEYSFEGKGSLRATLRGSETVHWAEVNAQIETLTANNKAGTLATDKLSLDLTARLTPSARGWKVDSSVRSTSGQAYGDPIFVDLGKNPLDAALRGTLLADGSALEIDSLSLDQKNLARMTVTGRISFEGPTLAQRLDIALDKLQFPDAYGVLLQPFLLDTDFKDLTTSGHLQGTVSVRADEPAALDVQLTNLVAKDKAGVIGIQNLTGHLVWSSREQPNTVPSKLSWQAANAYGLSGAATRIDFLVSGADFRLLKPAYIPVLDGGLFIRTLQAQEVGAPQMSLRFEGELQPIGMPRLCKAFGWPEFSGTLSGRIPEVRYEKGVLLVGGALEASAFDGQFRVDNLELRNPLGRYPKLRADVVLRGLDLKAVTGTFEFGTITGKLDGEVDDLELFRWAPVKMNLRLRTPDRDDSPHLISQRAVKNLSSIGGGGGSVAAALQGGFLRFFENFRYRRLGLNCRLENEVCHMDGVARAKGDSYYIVQGSGVPRIDIIGNARRVDWPRLVEQLKSIDESGGPVIR